MVHSLLISVYSFKDLLMQNLLNEYMFTQHLDQTCGINTVLKVNAYMCIHATNILVMNKLLSHNNIRFTHPKNTYRQLKMDLT